MGRMLALFLRKVVDPPRAAVARAVSTKQELQGKVLFARVSMLSRALNRDSFLSRHDEMMSVYDTEVTDTQNATDSVPQR